MKHLDADAIIRELESSVEHGFVVKRRLMKEASIKELKLALEQSRSPDVRCVIIEILGNRHALSAVDMLIPYVKDRSSDIRSETADALAKIKSPKAGRQLFEQYGEETNRGTRNMIAVALGAVGHTPAIPILIEALKSPDRSLRGSAAWSLGALRAVEARDALMQTLLIEAEPYPKERLDVALEELELSGM